MEPSEHRERAPAPAALPVRRGASLVLGGGGARGWAHIGVIRALLEAGLPIGSIAGCSMGALVGGIHATGKLDELEAWARGINRRQIFSLLDLSFGGGGLLKGERVIAALRALVGEVRIEELPVRFTAVAADIEREREVWIDDGPLFDAIRASISLPLFFTPVDRGGVRLVDGGVFDPVPIGPTYRDGTDLTVAVSLSGPASRPEAPPASVGGADLPARARRRAVWDLSYVVSQSLDAMQGVITRQKLAAHPPDLLIEIPRDACGLLDFERAAELIALGYELARRRIGAPDAHALVSGARSPL
jgi:NTE family protein